jgi:hypothetical protein
VRGVVNPATLPKSATTWSVCSDSAASDLACAAERADARVPFFLSHFFKSIARVRIELHVVS